MLCTLWYMNLFSLHDSYSKTIKQTVCGNNHSNTLVKCNIIFYNYQNHLIKTDFHEALSSMKLDLNHYILLISQFYFDKIVVAIVKKP